MPTYTFHNKKTQEEKTEVMSISEMEEYTKNNVDWEVLIMPLGRGVRDNFVASRHTNIPIDSDFNNILTNIRNNNPGSTMQW